MTYPMLGDGENDFSRSKGNWDTLPHYFMILTGDPFVTFRLLNRAPRKHFITQIWEHVFNAPCHKGVNPHLLPHGGCKWGNKFTVVTYRLDRNSRKRRFVQRKLKGAKA